MEDLLDLTQNLKGNSKTLINNSHSFLKYNYEFNDNNYSNNTKNLYDNCFENSSDNDSFDPSSNSYCSKTIQLGSKSNSQNYKEFLQTNFFGTYCCKKCNLPFYIDFMDNLELSFECSCTYFESYDISEFINQSEEFKIFCHYHKDETEFVKYCIDCQQDLCKKCLDKNCELNSYTSKYKSHKNHTLIDLNDITPKIEEIKHLINKCEELYENLESSLKEKLNHAFIVIESIIENYQKYKNYNSLKSIENAEKFLKKILVPEKNNFKFSKKKGNCIKKIKQISAKDFDENIKNHLKYIYNKINFSSFKNKTFQCLKEITINDSNFKDFSPLLSCKFPVLENLNLANNCIDNTIIYFLQKLDLTGLKILNLFKNNITDEKIFYHINRFKKLNIFFLGENPIEFGPNFKGKYEFPESVDEFGMTGNLDPIKANYIKRLEINNLKIFYISRNKIDNLEYIKDIEFKRLVEFYAASNKIKDIKQLMYIKGKQNLEIINLKENQIKNFNELIDIIKYFPKLKKLILTYNKIPENEAVEMKKKIKEIYNHELEIIV